MFSHWKLLLAHHKYSKAKAENDKMGKQREALKAKQLALKPVLDEHRETLTKMGAQV